MIAGGKVLIAGGNAGVLCIDPSRLELDGKEVDVASAQAALDKKWKELLAKYEQEKKKVDPDFAIASSTANAQLLPERLVPPQKFSIPALPLADQPVARRPAGADKIPSHLWALPFGTFAGSPTALSNERLPADWRCPVLDLPALTAEPDPGPFAKCVVRFPTSNRLKKRCREVESLTKTECVVPKS